MITPKKALLRPMGAVVCAALVFAPPVVGRDSRPVDPNAAQTVTSVEGVTEYRLPNGFRVLLYPDPTSPKVSVVCSVFVGSRHEGYGETGMAHLLEHMNFKGTPTHKEIKKALADRGADFNAATSFDQTCYYETLPGTDDNLEFAIRLEADRLVNSLLRHDDLAAEMTVVRNEFERNENSPATVLMQRVLGAAYEWHNYGKATIGNRCDIERVPLDRLAAFYYKHYRPENAMLVVAGKFDETRALGYAARYFGPLKNPAEKLDRTYTEEPAQDGERAVTLRRVGTTGVVAAAYHIPAASHPDFAPLVVLAQLLKSEPWGRLYKELVAAKKSSDVAVEAWNMHDPGLFLLSAGVNRDASAEEVRRVLLAAVESLGSNKVTVDEVRRARAELTNGWDRTSSHALAGGLREWAGCGDWRLLFLHRDRLKRVTADDVNRVAARYLVRSNRTVGEYVPTERPERAAVPAVRDPAAAVKDYAGGRPIAPGEEFDPTAENIAKRLRFATLASGVKAAFMPRKTRGETVTLQLTLRYGTEQSLTGLREACEFLPELMIRGARGRDYEAIDRELTELDSAALVAEGDIGVATFEIRGRREHLPRLVALLGAVLREPALSKEELETLKRATTERLRARLKEPNALAYRALVRKLHPYGKADLRYRPTLEESVARYEAVTVDQVRKLYATQVGGAHGELVVLGDFDPDEAARQVEAVLSDWKAGAPYRRIVSSNDTSRGGSFESIDTPDKASAVYYAAHLLAQRYTDPDYVALTVGNQILGRSGGSRLWDRVREKDGLSYTVYSSYSAGDLDPEGGFEVYAICNPANIAKVRTAVAEEIERLLKGGVTRAELEATKKALLDEWRTFSDREIITKLASDLVSGDSFAGFIERRRKLEALTVEQVNAALRKHLQPEKLVIVEAGDFRKPEARR
ncbi:M16 family metallopeptidase [Frigoriglobus tundricola]|uniref:M16 family peptidase n=1 Tax=Frigoriglobus tundricola TaxID=2774151 RepID=A0A6M5YLU4_9BACT|nr:pitrilysin family protein [Frigoriglobus tundricola]QJW94928.1 M16 family peptidase [Frigoriglobus tundricola]